jgi:hypothetical protein
MAAEYLGASSVIEDDVGSTPLVTPFALPGSGENRLIVLVVHISTGVSAPAPEDFTCSYGGVAITLDGTGVGESQAGFVGAVMYTEAMTDTDLSIAYTGGGTAALMAQAYVFDGVDPDFTLTLLSDSTTGQEFDLTGPTVAEEGDLAFTVAFERSVQPQLELANTGYTELTGVEEDGGGNKHFRAAWSATATGAQTLEWSHLSSGVIVAAAFTAVAACVDEFNCDCETPSPYKTLAELRTTFLEGVGYAAQAANPPPGMANLARMYLNAAQEFLWNRYKEARTERFFSWTMTPDVRYYGVADNDNCCTLPFDPRKVTWVGVQDLNGTWYQLHEGINPELYTRVQTSPGYPHRYEIRSCIEIFPAPQAAYTLHVKGQFGLGAFTADADRTTMDDDAVVWLAIGMYREDRGMNGAARWKNMALQRVMDITAGQHGTARFIPNPGKPLPPATPPRFLPLEE